MIFSRICVLGRRYDVFPTSNMPRDPKIYADKTRSADTVLLLPSVAFDAKVFAFGLDAGECDYIGPALAAATFLTSCRGLPLEEISVETDVGAYDTITLENSGKCGIKLPICKQLCSNKGENVGNVDVFFDDVLFLGKKIRIIKCSDAGCFAAENMARVTVSEECGEADIVSVISGMNDEYLVRSYSLRGYTFAYLYAAVAANYLLGASAERKMMCDGAELEFKRVDGATVLTSPFIEPSVFYAPDVMI